MSKFKYVCSHSLSRSCWESMLDYGFFLLFLMILAAKCAVLNEFFNLSCHLWPKQDVMRSLNWIVHFTPMWLQCNFSITVFLIARGITILFTLEHNSILSHQFNSKREILLHKMWHCLFVLRPTIFYSFYQTLNLFTLLRCLPDHFISLIFDKQFLISALLLKIFK